eukprot:gene30487-37711_t
MFTENDRNADIRMAHAQYFTEQIALANKEFHLPVLLGVNLNDTPASLAYNLLVTGRTPLSAQVPTKCKTPFGEVFCRGSVLLRWLPPPTNLADLPILSYVVAWRPGGSRTLGFSAQQDVSIGDCVKYGEQRDEKGVKRMANHARTNTYLPNERFSSTHIAICAEFVVDDNALSTQWW